MGPHSFLIISAIIFSSLSLYLPSKAEATLQVSRHPNKLLTEICKQSNDMGFCMALMNSKPQILSATNIRTVANFALAVARKQSIVKRNFFNRLASQAKYPASVEAFKDCAAHFNETVGMLNLDGLEGGTASLDVHYSLDNVQFCENGLARAKVDGGLISATIGDWKKYYSVAYASVEIVEDETETPSGL
ncbi:hypothetical protein MANES_18G093900v8 [Manihot esculenta]|uniref:Pectinesterase inhibitor domain-containing protein n=1 Tax=Manihot esculenta TaxID=3983 RepID=A0A2C9U215_MANES|nr:hypothetical protein MANES_18G093900v8 [Manihot esculenta]